MHFLATRHQDYSSLSSDDDIINMTFNPNDSQLQHNLNNKDLLFLRDAYVPAPDEFFQITYDSNPKQLSVPRALLQKTVNINVLSSVLFFSLRHKILYACFPKHAH